MFTSPERGVYEENRELTLRKIELEADNRLLKARLDAQQEVIDRMREWLEFTNGPMDTFVVKRKIEPPIQLPYGKEIYEFCVAEPYMPHEQPHPSLEVMSRSKITYE